MKRLKALLLFPFAQTYKAGTLSSAVRASETRHEIQNDHDDLPAQGNAPGDTAGL
jgi:hypothetical protein